MIDTDDKLSRRAYHEAGRALALYILCFDLAKGAESPAEDITTLLRYCRRFAGLSVESDRTNWRDVAEFWRATHLVFLGGCAAERIKWKIVETPSLSDTEFEKAYYAQQWLWVDLDYNPSKEQIFAETMAGLSKATEKLDTHWKAINALVTTLLKKSELSAEETFQIITANIDSQKLAIEREKKLPRKYGVTAIPQKGHSSFPLKSLKEAKSDKDGVVILQGDDGGQTYLVCLASQVACSEHDLELLLKDLDEIAWPGNYPDMRHIYYAGSMGGGVVSVEPWIHTQFIELGMVSAIHEVIQAKRERIR